MFKTIYNIFRKIETLDRKIETLDSKIDKLTTKICNHVNIDSYVRYQHSQSYSGFDILTVEYCKDCYTDLSKEVIGFEEYTESNNRN